MTNSRLRAARVFATACVAGILTVSVVAPSSGAAPAPNEPFVSLQGEGAWSVSEEIVPWQNELATATSSIDLNYVKHGSLLGREDLIAKQIDFAISGVPFTAGELKAVPGGASAFIDAPIQVATLATFVEPPPGGFHTRTTVCDPDDPTTWPNYPADPPPGFDPTVDCVVKAPYTGPIRIPSRNLAAMFLHYFGASFPPLLSWNNPDVLKAFGVQALDTASPPAGPGYAGRSDPDEINFFLQTFVKSAAPDVWQGNIQLNSKIPWEPITERIGQVAGVTRDGAEQQLDQLASHGCGVLGDCGAQSVSGGVAPAPPSMVSVISGTLFKNQPIEVTQMQNANGDWVSPSPDAINKAVSAGGETPLYALTNKVPGAYPLVWVDHLYAPAHGLSIEKTEGLAMLIRYLATTGQEKAASVGEGRLPSALVAKALGAANELVVSNCTGADRRIVSNTDPGPHAPASATAIKSIGNMLHCEAVPSVVTSTTTATTAPMGSNPSSSASGGFTGVSGGSSAVTSAASAGSGSSPDTRVASSAALSDEATSGGGGTGKTSSSGRSALLVATRLPLPVPTGSTGVDRLATFLLGAGLYLVLRKPVARLARRAAA
jgi:hypothetical protein